MCELDDAKGLKAARAVLENYDEYASYLISTDTLKSMIRAYRGCVEHAPAEGWRGLDIDALAQEIRRVDGENSLGAGALAEALVPYLQSVIFEPAPADGLATPPLSGETRAALKAVDANQRAAAAAAQDIIVGAAPVDGWRQRARELAEVVMSMTFVYAPGQHAKKLAMRVLGLEDPFQRTDDVVAITTNGTTRFIPRDEPVFLVRGQDVVGAETVLRWVEAAERVGVDRLTLETAREHAGKMQAWPIKKVATLSSAPGGSDKNGPENFDQISRNEDGQP